VRSSPPGAAARIFLLYGASVLSFLFFCLATSAAGFFFGAPISSSHFYLAGALTLLFAVFSCSICPFRGRVLDSILVIALLLLTFGLSFEIARSFFDLSYDGQAYHQEAVIHLSKGWNPFHENLEEWQVNRMGRWLQHYSKGVWFWETILFKATGSLEGAKVFHPWLMTGAFFMVLSFFRHFRVIPFLPALLISLLAAFNPVAIYQSLSFYLDGQLMSLMLILIVILAFMYREPSPYFYFLLFMDIAVLVNVKLTAAMYVVILLAGYLVVLWIKGKRSSVLPVFGTAAAGLLLGLLVFGFSPYVTNTLQKGNPFYPALGTDRSDYTNPQFPANFQGRNSLSLLFFSIFAKSDNVRGNEKRAYLKIPFTVSPDELKAFTDTNAKQGGFGPLFGGAVLISFLIYTVALRRLSFFPFSMAHGKSADGRPSPEPADRSPIILGLFSSGVLFASSLINPASSLARFIPQMWLFPIFALLLAYSLKGKFLRFAGHLLLLTLLANNILIAGAYYSYNAKITKLYHERLKGFATASEETPLHFYFGHFRSSSMLRFDEFGIRYQVVETKKDCHQGQRILPNSIVLKCDPE
jgi:hypothetical protein